MRQRISNRLHALEQRLGGAGRPVRWLRIIVSGKSTDEARADYEAEHGPIAAETGVVFRVMVEPERGSAPRS